MFEYTHAYKRNGTLQERQRKEEHPKWGSQQADGQRGFWSQNEVWYLSCLTSCDTSIKWLSFSEFWCQEEEDDVFHPELLGLKEIKYRQQVWPRAVVINTTVISSHPGFTIALNGHSSSENRWFAKPHSSLVCCLHCSLCDKRGHCCEGCG